MWSVQQKSFVMKVYNCRRFFKFGWARWIRIYDPLFAVLCSIKRHLPYETDALRHVFIPSTSRSRAYVGGCERLPRGTINLTALIRWHFTHPYFTITPPSITVFYWKGYPPIWNRIELCGVWVEAGRFHTAAQNMCRQGTGALDGLCFGSETAFITVLTNQLTGAELFLRNRQSLNYSRISEHFMRPEMLLPHSQEPSTSPNREPDQSSPYNPILSL
jgi:hypothetical protein